MHIIRIKDLQRREERIRKIKELVDASKMDQVDKVRELFRMYHLD